MSVFTGSVWEGGRYSEGVIEVRHLLTRALIPRTSALATHIINAKWILDHHYSCMIYCGGVNGAQQCYEFPRIIHGSFRLCLRVTQG